MGGENPAAEKQCAIDYVAYKDEDKVRQEIFQHAINGNYTNQSVAWRQIITVI